MYSEVQIQNGKRVEEQIETSSVRLTLQAGPRSSSTWCAHAWTGPSSSKGPWWIRNNNGCTLDEKEKRKGEVSNCSDICWFFSKSKGIQVPTVHLTPCSDVTAVTFPQGVKMACRLLSPPDKPAFYIVPCMTMMQTVNETSFKMLFWVPFGAWCGKNNFIILYWAYVTQ